MYRENQPILNDVQKRIVKDLKGSGIAFVDLDELFPGKDLLFIFQNYVKELCVNAGAKNKKTYLKYLWDIDPVIDFSNPFIKLAISSTVLDIVNSYLEMYAHFFTLTLNVTTPVKGGGVEAIESQRWHRDPQDRKIVKVLIYLSDVDEESGPFIYIPYSPYGLKWGSCFPQKPPIGCYPGDEKVLQVIHEKAIKICTAKAGTMIFCDTTGLHKGGYAISHERIMFTAGYESNSSAWPDQYKCGGEFENELNKIGASPAWRHALAPNQNKFSARLLNLYWRWRPRPKY